jgi:hypothetical protein
MSLYDVSGFTVGLSLWRSVSKNGNAKLVPVPKNGNTKKLEPKILVEIYKHLNISKK